MREHCAIRTHKSCVSCHSHVRFKIFGSPTVSIFDPEAKGHGNIGSQWRGVAFPDHAPAVGQLRQCGIVFGWRKRPFGCLRIVSGKRHTRDVGQVDLPNRSPWHAIVINNIRENLVLASDNGGQVFRNDPPSIRSG